MHVLYVGLCPTNTSTGTQGPPTYKYRTVPPWILNHANFVHVIKKIISTTTKVIREKKEKEKQIPVTFPKVFENKRSFIHHQYNNYYFFCVESNSFLVCMHLRNREEKERERKGKGKRGRDLQLTYGVMVDPCDAHQTWPNEKALHCFDGWLFCNHLCNPCDPPLTQSLSLSLFID